MGTWGIAVFSDDLAVDVRDEWRRLVGDGSSGEEATVSVLERHGEDASDPDECTVFWVALALTQHRAGRPEALVIARAIECIDSGADLARWSDDVPGSRKRREVLEAARAELSAPAPPERRIARKFMNTCTWVPGEVIRYTLRSGAFAYMQMLGTHIDAGGTSPVVQLLDWTGDSAPSAEQISGVGVRTSVGYSVTITRLLIGATSAREYPMQRLRSCGMIGAPPLMANPAIGAVGAGWRGLDDTLAEHFGLG